MKKDLPTKFNVPDEYFVDLERDILDLVVPTTSNKVVPLYKRYWVAVTTGLAASILLVIGIYTNSANDDVTPADHTAAKEILIEAYLDEDVSLDEFELNDAPLYADILD